MLRDSTMIHTEAVGSTAALSTQTQSDASPMLELSSNLMFKQGSFHPEFVLTYFPLDHDCGNFAWLNNIFPKNTERI